VEEEAKSPEGDGAKPAKKKGSKLVLLVLGAVVATATSAAAGAVLGPALTGAKPAKAEAASRAAAAHAAAERGGEGEGPVSEPAALDPIIVDVREANGEMHHLKVGIAVELGVGVPEEEFKKLIPRMRDAAISFLRGLPFDDIASPQKFDAIRNELGERMSKAAGKGRVQRVLFTDFVAQ
jgi:flagellar FliL protein